MIRRGDVGKRFRFSNQVEIPFSYNIRPSQPALIVTRNSPNKGEVRPFGIKAPWEEKRLLINAQAETVAATCFKPTYREDVTNCGDQPWPIIS
jgi:putative SOS response-associated peptidase YedK